MPNVLILPRSADYSEEVWMEIREKAICIIQQFFIDNTIPTNAVSDEEEEEERELESMNEQSRMLDNETSLQGSVGDEQTENVELVAESSQKKVLDQSKETSSQNQSSVISPSTSNRSETKRNRSSKKAKKRHGRQKSQNKVDDALTLMKESSSYREDDATMSGTDQVLSSSEDSRNRKTPVDAKAELTPQPLLKSSAELVRKSGDVLKDGYIVSLHARDHPALHVSRQRVQGGGWFLDTLSNVTKRDPAAQFLVVCRSKVLRYKARCCYDYVFIHYFLLALWRSTSPRTAPEFLILLLIAGYNWV